MVIGRPLVTLSWFKDPQIDHRWHYRAHDLSIKAYSFITPVAGHPDANPEGKAMGADSSGLSTPDRAPEFE
jgi:hypothetical protein